jgi:hypothetical protein
MNGFYEAQKIDVRHGAIDDDSRNRALQALRDAGADVVDAMVAESKPEVDNPLLLDAPVVATGEPAMRPVKQQCRPPSTEDDIAWAIEGAKRRFPRIEADKLNCDGGGLLS